MHFRQDTGVTLKTLAEKVGHDEGESTAVATTDVTLALEDGEIRFGERVVPVTNRGVKAFGKWLGVPAPFQKRIHTLGTDLEQTILTELLRRSGGATAAITWSDAGVLDVRDPGQNPIPAIRLVNLASRVLDDENAPVQRLIDEPGEFAFDAHVSFDAKHGVYGDGVKVDIPEQLRGRSYTAHLPAKTRQVGDVTAGGIRLGYDRKRNLAPWVQPWFMRLVCTNGMEATDFGLRVDARGQSVDDVLIELEAAAERAFSRVEEQIKHFYDLRNQPAGNPERVIRRIARERGIPDRSVTRLLDLAPTDALPDNPSMFDVVNLVTNLANDPAMIRDGGRLILERAGGSEIVDHLHRCSHCNKHDHS